MRVRWGAVAIVLCALLLGCGSPGRQSPLPPLTTPRTEVDLSYPQFQTPVVSDTTLAGSWTETDALSTTNGTWGSSPTAFSYVWEDCNSSGTSCAPIGGATSSTYVLAGGDVGSTIRSVVRACNRSGCGTAASAPSGVVVTNSGSGTGLRVSAADEPCPNTITDACADLVDANGNVVHMHGVDLSGTEYACVTSGGLGIFASDGTNTQNTLTDVQDMVSWHINFVRIQLNEDCWLGINTGLLNPSYVDTSPGVGAYASAIESFVTLLHQNGIYTEIVDMWNAPGTNVAVGQSGSVVGFNSDNYYGPDLDHSPAMWASMAQAFAGDSMTILSPSGEEDVSMSCEMNGCNNEGLAQTDVDGLGACSNSLGSGYCFKVAGLSQAVTTMRADGFEGPIALGCAHYEDTCSSWIADKPTDSLGTSQLLAEVHNYSFASYTTPAGWEAQYLPIVQAGYPLFYGELGEGSGSNCGDTYLPEATSWADAYGIGYMNWTWTADTSDCEQLVSSYSSSAPPTVASFTGNTTNASTSIASVSSATGLIVGQVIAGTGIPTGDTIVACGGSAACSGSTLTMSLESTATNTGTSLTAYQGGAGWIQAHDESFLDAAPQTNVSSGQPTYANSGASGAGGSGSPSEATDGTYDSSNSGGCACNPGAAHYYECNHTATSGSPCYVDVNVGATLPSGCNTAGTCQIIVAFYSPENSGWEDTSSAHVYNAPGSYTINTCSTSCTGTPPTTGWVTKDTVTGSIVSSNVTAPITLPANTKWIQFNDTSPSPANQSGNNDLTMGLDVLTYNPPAGEPSAPPDTTLVMGDSVTQYSMTTQEPSNYMQFMNSLGSQYYPVMLSDGIGGWDSNSELTTNSTVSGNLFIQDVTTWWKGHYVAIDYGGLSETCAEHLAGETGLIQKLVYAGFQPEMRYSVSWTSAFSSVTASEQINQINAGPALASGTCSSDGLTFLFMRFPTMVVGPDFWGFYTQLGTFPASTAYEDGSNVHPEHPTGENAYRQLYDQTALFNAHSG